MRKALQIYVDHVYEVLALLLYMGFFATVLLLFSFGVFVVANSFVQLPLWLGFILFAIFGNGMLLSFFNQLYQMIQNKKISLDDFTANTFIYSLRSLPIIIVKLLLMLLILIPVFIVIVVFPQTLENTIFLVIYAIYGLFAMFIVGYLTIPVKLLVSIYDYNPISAIKQGLIFSVKNASMLFPFAIWFVSCLTLFLPLINILTYFTLFPASTINLLLSFKSLSMGRRLPL